MSEPTTAICSEEAAGYGGMFGVYCSLPAGHEGPHNDGYVEWDFVEPGFRNTRTPPQAPSSSKAGVMSDPPETT